MTGAETSSITGLRKRTQVSISRDKMTALLTVSEPQAGEPQVTVDEIRHALVEGRVTFGVDDEKVQQVVAERLFGQPVCIASGRPLVKGDDAQFEYTFETDQTHVPQESDGLVDYRNINFIQSIAAGELLARKTPPTEGSSGMGVDGVEIPARPGRDARFSFGPGCEVSEDGVELKATVDGAVVFKNGNISVSDVTSINGDVDFNVGNLDCAGSLKVSGKVLAGFKIDIKGNLEIGDNVEDAQIRAGGNVIIKGGFFGSGEGFVESGGELVVKYVDGQEIRAGGSISVAGELLNCRAVSQGSIVVSSQHGRIIGGEVIADRRIEAWVIGSEAGTPTRLTVAANAELMEEYESTCRELSRITEDFERVKQTMQGLYRLQLDSKLKRSDQRVLRKLERFSKEAPAEIDQLQRRKTQVEAQMEHIRDARIVTHERIYPGVELHFGFLKRRIIEEMGPCTFSVEGFEIVRSEQVEPAKRS